MNICTSCGKGTLSPIIKSSPFLIVKEICTGNEVNSDRVFVQEGENKYHHQEHTTSWYLAKELGMCGLNINTMCLTNLYLHIPPKGGRSKEGKAIVAGCEQFSIDEFIKVAKDMKIILMGGAATIKTFTGYNASEVYGLPCKSELLPNVPVIIPMPNPDKIMSSPIGEMRLALKVFAQQIKVYEQFMNMES
jgi:hypothetical protein